MIDLYELMEPSGDSFVIRGRGTAYTGRLLKTMTRREILDIDTVRWKDKVWKIVGVEWWARPDPVRENSNISLLLREVT